MAKPHKSSFVAIGVGQGDAFFLDKAGITALIDGGRSMQGFPTQFQRVTKQDSVDILVCTHNDADHALGVLGFLRSGLTCKEVWLPGSWTDRLEDLLVDAERFAEELISNVAEMEVEPEKRPLLQAVGDQYSEEMIKRERDNDNERTASTDALSEAFEMAAETEAYRDISWLYPPPPWPPEDWPGPWHKLRARDHGRFWLFVEAISAASRIREISLAAYHIGALIRWFEYDSASSNGGVPGFLVPLNAREILRMRRRRWTALYWLALTTANKQSLVFLSPADEKQPAVLLTADSDLSFSHPIPWSDGMVMTAPHHGSEANAHAYRRIVHETGNSLDVVWVRSDGRFFKTRPGSSYLQACGSRFCTICRGSNNSKQDVRLAVASQTWKPVSTRKCCCV